ncbi:latent-transforming growth factor beta-binding protein 2 isoform X2 [Strongylocentrotus purpuratus]|uniref:TIL domain-containing protein n=1 Tax=Strongylocentrotus purpuratus TaxID=7668 RepID=A0A7M7P3M2_STRPU|nr:latent-transforming growth factor beta-binding protein 2 isoform X2 [Strongylocentrotus purpuratus]
MVATIFFQFVLVGLLALSTEANDDCDDVIVNCFVNPCDYSVCSANPDAECRSNYCGGCNADFYVDDVQVNCSACPEGMTFNECGSGCGPSSCDNLSNDICPLFCFAGCFCPEGLVKDRDGGDHCIPLDQCQESCEDEGEFFNDCGSPCGEPSCDERDRGKGECIESCQPGCFCDSANGFIRDENNRCIQENECPPPRCDGEGEFFNACGSPCGEPSCDERDRGKGVCIKRCQPGCFCDSANGFIRDQSNRCIQEEQCTLPGQCINEGEVYRVCSSHCGEATCAGVPQVRCANLCLSLCLCDNDNGYVRGPNGDCILLSNCQQAENCQQDETYSVFRHPCDLEESLCPGYPEPPYRPGGPPIAGCFCSEGLLRHNGQCISPVDCPPCNVVSCKVDPCLLATCGASPNARCMSNYCGGCNFTFYDSQCREVQCDGKPTY